MRGRVSPSRSRRLLHVLQSDFPLKRTTGRNRLHPLLLPHPALLPPPPPPPVPPLATRAGNPHRRPEEDEEGEEFLLEDDTGGSGTARHDGGTPVRPFVLLFTPVCVCVCVTGEGAGQPVDSGSGAAAVPDRRPDHRGAVWANQTIVDDIHHGNSEPYGVEPLRELLKLLPETEEVKKLKSYRGDISKLSLADSFVYLLIQLPSYSVRIESMLLKEEFPAVCEAMKRDIKILRTATKELMCCEELHAVLHLVLQAGNILNAGGYAGNAVGFKLSSLLALADTKANKPGMNLLHFVALVSHLVLQISVETLDADLQRLTSRTRSVEESVQRDTELLQQLDDFLQSATLSLCSLRGGRQQLKTEGSELIDFFCEDRETFRLDDCFSIFHTFCSRFTSAVKENLEREAKEAARRRRIQELEEQKRHSWAGGEEVGGAFGLRCSSETDMSAAMSRHNEAGRLVELLTPKSRPRSPLNNNPLGRSGSLRRSRNFPSTSPTMAAERELSTLLGMTSREDNQQRGGGTGEARTFLPSASPESGLKSPGVSPQTRPHSITTCIFPQNQQPQTGQTASQTHSSPRKNSLSANHTTAAYLSYDARQTQSNTIAPTNKVTIKPTSDANQQSRHNNDKDQLGLRLSNEETLSDHQSDPDFHGRVASSDEKFERSTAAPGNMSVVLEKHTLVPELKVFETVANEGRLHGQHQNDMLITDLEEVGADESQVQKMTNESQIGNTDKSNVKMSSLQRDEDEGREEKVVVWCVTGVCEAAGELTLYDNAQTERDQSVSDNHGGSQQPSSTPTNLKPSEPQPANEKPVPVPISSQPVPASRCDDPSHPISSPRWHPSANEAPTVATGASEEAANQEEEVGGSTNEKRDVETLQVQSTDKTTNENKEADSSTNKKVEPIPSSKPSTKNLPTSRTRPPGIKPVTPTAASTTNKVKPVRTLTNSENQGMRRVVPISRTSRGAPSLGKRPEKPPGNQRGHSITAAPASVSMSNLSSTSLHRGERPSTAPSSRRSSINKTPDPKDSKDQKVSGTLLSASSQEQNQDLQRKPSVRKPLIKPKLQPEEKMCRSTLRALTQGGAEGGVGGGSISAPTTPLHKAPSSSSSPLPSFARSTASSSFRRTHTNVTPPTPPPSPHTGSDSSPKTSSVAPPGTSSPLTRTGSLRVSSTASTSSSPLTKSQSIRATAHSPLRGSQAPPKGHRRNDSGSFSEKSTHSRDSGKSTRPSWR
ncbi:FH2 domain-containing protein 1 [Nibea albiflora]|uniref:FH2 domain-containing protein 1 n=1 Tax=Nibea albiflora TaxID=240163 RepID=A0ACB7EVY1_NIBAL|nr:FH2 domain-containing protein 1 [Nibea albiflora]